MKLFCTFERNKYHNSIKNRNDLGDALRLELGKITSIKRSMIIVVRSWHGMHKLKALCKLIRKSMKEYAIVFLHDAPKQTSDF